MLTHLLAISRGLAGPAWPLINCSRDEAEQIARELTRIPGVHAQILDTADRPPVNHNALLVNLAYQGEAQDGSEDVEVEFHALSWPDDPKGQAEWARTLGEMPEFRVAGFCQNLGPAEAWAATNGVA